VCRGLSRGRCDGVRRGRQRRPCGAPGFSQTFRPARPPPPPDSRLKLFERKDGPSRAASAPLRTERLRHPRLARVPPRRCRRRADAYGFGSTRLAPPSASATAPPGAARGGFGCDGLGAPGFSQTPPARAPPAAPPTAAPRSWPCEGGAGPGGGRRRPPRPAPLARRAPAPASPPVADELPPVLHPPRRRRPRRLPKGLGARLGARGSGLGSRENSPPVPRPCALRTCTHGPSSAAPAPAPPSSAARRHRLRTGGGRHPSPRGGARGGRRLDFTGPRSRTARRRGPLGAGSYAGPLA
jgi:hypothetical protein